MTKFTSCLLLIATVCTMVVAVAPQQAHAQDPEFSQFYSNPLLLNPAFAGTARGPSRGDVPPQPMARHEWCVRDPSGQL